MLKLYYRIWADAIIYEQTKNGHFRNWKFYTLVPISMIMGVNLLTVSLVVGKVFDLWILGFLNINLFPIESVNKVLAGIITLFLPFIFFNYFIVFHKKQYKWIVKKFPYKQGRVYLVYVLGSLSIIILPLIILVLFFQ